MGANQHTSKGRKAGYRIKLTDTELTSLHARANAEGVTLADLIRACLGLAEAPSVRDNERAAAASERTRYVAASVAERGDD
jgi:hypothetical protein